MTWDNREGNIIVQTLGVSHSQPRPGCEQLVYAPGALVEGMPDPETILVPTNAIVVRRQIAEIRQAVLELLWRIRLAKCRDGQGVEAAAAELVKQIMPGGGFCGVVRRGLHPHFLVEGDLAAEIPWEALEDSGGEMGKLAADRFLTYRVRGGEPPKQSGNGFLLIDDPTQDVCSSQADMGGRCAEHVGALKSMLGGAGYRVLEIRRRNATVARVKSAIQDPETLGLYFFGHGYFPEQGSEGCLALADGPLLAREIKAARPDLRFVFLNACESARRGDDWALERKSDSVGEMFARGGMEKSVIAPLFPMVNIQAAEAALRFFNLVLEGKTIGEGLQQTRRESLVRYRQDQPDITWMAYRHFGDPRRRLPPPRETRVEVRGVDVPPPPRLFRPADGKLDAGVFGFNIQPVLFRAAKRRNLQRRRLLTVQDLVAGLIRVGDLTRFVLRELRVDPDHVYTRLLNSLDEAQEDATAAEGMSAEEIAGLAAEGPGSGAAANEDWFAKFERLLANWMVHQRDQCSSALVKVLEVADKAALCRSEDGGNAHLSEEDLLLAIIDGQAWPLLPETGIPGAEQVRRGLACPEKQRSVDANGRLVLDALTVEAHQVIETSHQHAQQRGAIPISNRLLLASFLSDSDAYPARLCQRHGVDTKTLSAVLIAATPARTPKTFDLTHEACGHVILPCLARAWEYRQQWGEPQISLRMLFKAFCEVAAPTLVDTLRSKELPERLRLDLVEIGKAILPEGGRATGATFANGAPPPGVGIPIPQNGVARQLFPEPGLADSVKRIFVAAAYVARLQGYEAIRSPHLFVAAVSYGGGLLRARLERGPLSSDQLVLNMLLVVPPRAQPPGQTFRVQLSRTVGRILETARQAATSQGRPLMEEADLLAAMFEDHNSVVARTLVALGFAYLLHEVFDE